MASPPDSFDILSTPPTLPIGTIFTPPPPHPQHQTIQHPGPPPPRHTDLPTTNHNTNTVLPPIQYHGIPPRLIRHRIHTPNHPNWHDLHPTRPARQTPKHAASRP